jgi:succinate-acetate transporter protein
MSTPASTVPAPVPFAEPTPLGLLGLSIGCAALLPIAFGMKDALTPEGLRAAAMFCLLFGAGGQFLAGVMSLANRNMLGGTLFTAFSFNWVMNWWTLSGLAEGKLPNEAIGLSVDVTFLLIFAVMTYAFGFYSKLLFAFLFDIDLLYVFRLARALTHAPAFATLVAVATVGLMAISLYIAFAMVLNTASGRALLPMPGPLFAPPAPAPGVAVA